MKQYHYTAISVSLLILLLSACRSNKHDGSHPHAENEDYHQHNDHEETHFSYTTFSGGYELFAEFEPLAVEESSHFNIHLTRLADYKPLNEGSIMVSLTQEKTMLQHRVDTTAVPGIFKLWLQPEKAGDYLLEFELIVGDHKISFEPVLVVVAKDAHARSGIQEKELNAEGISFLKEQAWKTEFAVQEVDNGDFREVISTSGQILPANGDESIVVAPFAGIVKLAGKVMAGKEVKRNEILLSLGGHGLASNNYATHFTELKTNYEKAKSNYDRLKELIADKIVSEKDFEEAKAEYEQAKAAFENLEDSGDGKEQLVRANLTGYIKDVKISDGEFVEAGHPLVVISQNKRLILRADVSQNHWHCLPDIRSANFMTVYDNQLYRTSGLNGQLISYGRNVNNSAWSTPVFFEIDNLGNLIPGSYVEIYLLSKPMTDVISIPVSALLEEQDHFYVFVQLSGELYEKRLVTTGVSDGAKVEVVSGLNKGEYIVSRGAYQVKLASMASSLPSHDHNH